MFNHRADVMENNLHKKVSTRVTIQESSKTNIYEQVHNHKNVIGLHDSSISAFKDYIEGLDPSNPYDMKILNRIASGN
jgi:hypothetical protein